MTRPARMQNKLNVVVQRELRSLAFVSVSCVGTREVLAGQQVGCVGLDKLQLASIFRE